MDHSGMKQAEFKNCVGCGRGMASGKNIHFYRLKIEQFVLDVDAIKREIGLQQFFGGGSAAAGLAAAMGSNPDLAKGMGETVALICGECGVTKRMYAAQMLETAGRQDDEKEKA